VALFVLRRRQPNMIRPYKQWLYPVPGILALIGWVYVYSQTSLTNIWLSLGWLVLGTAAFLIWASTEKVWPFGPKEVKEEFLAAVTT